MKTTNPFMPKFGYTLFLLLFPFAVQAEPVTATTEPFDVIPAAGSEFIFTVNPPTTGAGETTSFTVQTLDEFGNVTNDHNGYVDILSVSGDTDFAAGFSVVDFPAPPAGADPFETSYAEHTFEVCFRLAGEYTLTISAPGMTSAEHTITVEPTILWNAVTNTSVTYMDDYYQILYAYDPAIGPVFNYTANGLPPGLSISTSFDLIDTIAGNGVADYNAADNGGQAIDAAIGDPQGIAVAADGTVYMTDSWNGLVRKRTPDGTISTVLDVEATFGTFGAPFGIVMKGDSLYVTDAAHFRVYQLDRANSYNPTVLLDGTDGLVAPFGLAIDSDTLYIANTFAHEVLAYDLVTTDLSVLAGTGSAGFTADGVAATASGLNFPEDVAVGPDGNVYIADTDNHRIRMVDGDGIITTIAGTGASGFSGDGGPATAAELQGSAGIGVDSAGRIVISDTFNNRLRLVRANGDIETIAGGNTAGLAGDGGDAADSRLFGPTGIAFGPDMSIYIADTGNHRVRQVYLSVAVLSGNPEDVNRDEHGDLIPYDVTLNAHPGYGCGVDYLFDLDVLPKELDVINAAAASKTYDATTDAVVSGADLSGIEAPGGIADDVSLTHATVGVFAQDGVGEEIAVTTSMGLTGDHAYRYTIAQPDYLEADIYHRLVTYAVDGGQGKVYGDSDNNADLTGVVDSSAGDGLVSDHSFTIGSLLRDSGEDVGNYAITQGSLAIEDASNTDVTANYDLTFVSDDFVITQRALSIVAAGATKVFGQDDPAFPFNEPALQWDDEFVGALSREAGQDVSGYDFLIGSLTIEDGSGVNVAHNYDISFDGTTNHFTITPALLTVTANDDTKTYDGVAYSGGNDVVINGFQFSDNRSNLGGSLTFSGSSQGAVNQGTYVIAPSGFTSSNYTFDYVNGELTILRRALEITANDRSKTYGDTIILGTSEFTTDGGEASGEAVISVVLTAEANADSNANASVGSYDITPSAATGSGGFVADNYDITYTDGTLTVGTRSITITANDQDKIYGNSLSIPDTAFDLDGTLAPGESVDTVVLTVESNAALDENADVGSYTITPAGAAGTDFTASNYAITYETGTLTVDQRPLTITADNRSKLYGETLDLGTADFTLTGLDPILAPGEALTAVTLTSAGAAEKASVTGGPYAIETSGATGTGGFDVANYDITYSSEGTLTIDPREITVTADSQSKTFGEPHDLGTTAFTVSGETLVDEPIENVDLTSTGTALCANVADSHPILISEAAGSNFDSDNYAISYVNGLLTISPAEQEILYTEVTEPVEWKDVITMVATRDSNSACDAPADIEFAATAPGFVAGDELTFNMRGPVTITATLDGDSNYFAANDVTQDILVRAEPVWESTPVTSATVSVDYSYELAVSDLDGWRWDLSLVAVDPATPDWLSIRHAPDERRIHLFAGTGDAGTDDGAAVTGPNFPAKSAEFDRPYGLAITADMTVYVADRDNHVVRRIHPWGSVEIVAGTMDVSGFAGDGGAATDARLAGPRNIALSPDESLLYIADTGNHRVRKVDLSTGIITTVAGSGGFFGHPGEGVDATATQLGSPYAVVATADKLYIASVGLHRIRVVDLDASTISTLVGTSAGNPLNQPTGLFLDGDNLYIADRGRHRIARFDLNTESLTNVAGTAGTSGFEGDGGDATEALLNQPHAITLADGVLYITDSNNHRIRTVDLSNGIISTLSGGSTNDYFGDNIHGGDALLNGPRGIVSDGHGHIFFADMNNHRIRRIDNGTSYLEGIPYQAGDYEVTLHADDSWFATEQVFTITVDPYTPDMDVWADADSIIYGDLLGSALLTGGLATDYQGDPIPGTFSWDDEDALLIHGTHNPSITFTPNDTDNYETVTSNDVSVFVAKRELTVTAVPDPDSIVYGDSAPSVSVAYDGFITGEDESDLANTGFVLGTDYAAGDEIGTYNTTIAIGTAEAANYSFNLQTETFEVTRRVLNVTYSADSRIYDGTTNVVVTTTDDRFGSDDLTVNFTAAFVDKFVATGKTVEITGSSLNGPDAGNYTVAATATTTANITPRTLNITFTGVHRGYNGGTVSSVTATDDRVENDEFVIMRTAAFRDKNVGTNKPVDISGVSLSGGDAVNYTVSYNNETVANIDPRTLTLSNFVADSKMYDGNTDVLSGAGFSDDREVGDLLEFTYDVVFEDKNAGTNKDVLFTNIAISGGAHILNYTLAENTGVAKADITARDLVLSNFVADSKTYDGSRSVLSGDGFDDNRVEGDLLEFAYTVLFDTRDAGVNKDVDFTNITISGGADADNYSLVTTTGTASADITPLELGIGGSFTAQSKTYDRTDAVVIDPAGLTLQTPLIGDDVVLTDVEAEFVSVLVGEAVTVGITGAALSGDHQGNYSLTIAGAPEASADILRRDLTVADLTGVNREYDGTTGAAADGTAVLQGIISPDEVTLAGTPVYTFADPNAANGIEITTTGFILDGPDAANYDVIQPVLAGDILPLPVAITPDSAQSKTAGDADPVFTYTADPLLLGGDTFSGSLSRVDAEGNTAGQFAYDLGSLDAGSNYLLSLSGIEPFTVHPSEPVALTIDQIDPLTGDVVSPAGGTVGEFISIRISAVDAYGNVAIGYDGNRRLRLSGPQNSPLGDIPFFTESIEDGTRQTVEFDAVGPAVCNFIEGIFETEVVLFTAETVTVRGFSTANNNDFNNGIGFYTEDDSVPFSGYPLEIEVLPAIAERLLWAEQPSTPVRVGETWPAFSVEISDLFGNRTDDDNEITLTLNQTLALSDGSSAVQAVDGLAVFDDFVAAEIAEDLSFTASAVDLTPTPESEMFDVIQGQAALVTAPTTASITFGQTLGAATLDNGDATVGGTFAFTNPLTAPNATQDETPEEFEVTFTPDDSDNYLGFTVMVEVTVDKADAVISVTGVSVTYDGEAYGASGTATGADGSDLSSLLDLGDMFTNVPGGTAEWTFAGDDNHNAAYGNVEIEITPKAVVVSPAAGQSKVFGESDPVFTFTATDLVGDDEITGELARELGEDVGDYAFDLGTLTAGTNYTLSLVAEPATFEITQATPVVVTALSASDLILGQTLSESSISGAMDVSGTFSFADPGLAPPVGTAAQTLIFTPDSGNYVTLTDLEVAVTVNYASPYDEWLADFADIVGDGPNSGPMEDYSGDGMPNLMAMAFGLDPREDNRGYQALTLENNGAGPEVHIDLTGQNQHLIYTVLATEDLRTWIRVAEAHNGGPLEVIPGNDLVNEGDFSFLDGYGLFTTPQHSRLFFRLTVALPEN